MLVKVGTKSIGSTFYGVVGKVYALIDSGISERCILLNYVNI